MKYSTDDNIDVLPRLMGFLSNHESKERVVTIDTDPDIIYLEDGRDSFHLNFDFIVRGLTERKLIIRFIKMAAYDRNDNLIFFRHVNHNGVGTPSIHTIGCYEIHGQETLDVFNPFHRISKERPVSHLRYMFTFYDPESKSEFYYGNVIVEPVNYSQEVELSLPVKGLVTILDGHDFYSHHRRFAMSLVRQTTGGRFASNFSRYAIDLTLLGADGNTRRMQPGEQEKNYDFHFSDAREFYTDTANVFAPADGEIVDFVEDLDDLYSTPFNFDNAINENRIHEIVGNYLVIKHNDKEFSHLFHLKKNSLSVKIGQHVERGEPIAKIGFSGAATTYSHLHYQLMDGAAFLKDNPLPCRFSDVTLLMGSEKVNHNLIALDTGDFIIAE